MNCLICNGAMINGDGNFKRCINGHSQYPPDFKPYDVISEEESSEGIKEPKPQKQYTKRKIGTFSKCSRKNQKIYCNEKDLCQVCYRRDLELRKREVR